MLASPRAAYQMAGLKFVVSRGGPQDLSAVEGLLQARADRVRVEAAKTYACLLPSRSAAPLAAMALSDRASVRLASAFAMGRLGNEDDIGILRGLLGDSAVLVRCAAVEGLGRLSGARSVADLCQMLADPSAPVRRSAVVAYGMAGGSADPARLIPLLSDETWSVQREAALTFARIAQPSQVERVLETRLPPIKWGAAAFLDRALYLPQCLRQLFEQPTEKHWED